MNGKDQRSLQENWRYQGNITWKVSSTKDRNDKDLTEAEKVARIHIRTVYHGVATQSGPDILEFEVKWALRSITMNRASGRDGIPAELFQILKDAAAKVIHSLCQQIWKTQQWPQDWKMSFHSNPKKGQCQRIFKLLYNCAHVTCYQGNAQNPSS